MWPVFVGADVSYLTTKQALRLFRIKWSRHHSPFFHDSIPAHDAQRNALARLQQLPDVLHICGIPKAQDGITCTKSCRGSWRTRDRRALYEAKRWPRQHGVLVLDVQHGRARERARGRRAGGRAAVLACLGGSDGGVGGWGAKTGRCKVGLFACPCARLDCLWRCVWFPFACVLLRVENSWCGFRCFTGVFTQHDPQRPREYVALLQDSCK